MIDVVHEIYTFSGFYQQKCREIQKEGIILFCSLLQHGALHYEIPTELATPEKIAL
jgi:hypothetical protein